MESPRLLLAVLWMEQGVEHLRALVGIRVTGTAHVVELLPQLFVLQTGPLAAQDLL